VPLTGLLAVPVEIESVLVIVHVMAVVAAAASDFELLDFLSAVGAELIASFEIELFSRV